MKHKIMMILCVFLLVACSGNGSKDDKKNEDKSASTTSPVEAGDYEIMLPFKSSDTRQTHVEFNRGSYDRNAIGKGLEEYSKQHFSVSKYVLQEGEVIDRDILQTGYYYGDVTGLLGYNSDTNPIGLNPRVGSTIPINGSQEIIAGDGSNGGNGTIPLIDIFELNFIKKGDVGSENPDISGISLAIVLNDTIYDNAGNEVKIDREQLIFLGSEQARQLVAYLRQDAKVGQSTPIYVMLFNASSNDSSLPGNFIADGYGSDSINNFNSIKEEWYLFPSVSAQEIDSVTHAQFETIKNSIYGFIPNDTGIIGKGKFTNDRLDTLYITVNAQAKTYTESNALTQYINGLLTNIKSEEVEIVVDIKVDNETFAIIQRKVGTLTTTVIRK